jgi:hypothetical protein
VELGPTEAAIHLESLFGFAFLLDEVRPAVDLEFGGCVELGALVLAPAPDLVVVVESVVAFGSSTFSDSVVLAGSSLESSVSLESSGSTCVPFICNNTASFLPLKILQTGHLIIADDEAAEAFAWDGCLSWWPSDEFGGGENVLVPCTSEILGGTIAGCTFRSSCLTNVFGSDSLEVYWPVSRGND